ncbi:MAG: NADH-quinone oxidoreductase subunit N [Actinomycetes bacterium]
MSALAAARITTPGVDWLSIAPVAILGLTAVAIVLARALIRKRPAAYPVAMGLTVLGLGLAAVALLAQWHRFRVDGPYQSLSGMVAVDGFAAFIGLVVVFATAMAVLLASRYLVRERFDGPEYLTLMLLSSAGMVAMASANDLIAVFVALEIVSIPLYVLAAFDRRRTASLEAGLKYFLLGAFASAVFLYGVALTYGATGSTNLTLIAGFLAGTTLLHEGALLAGLALMLVGLGFKVAAAPFQMWTPDVYEGAPTPVTAFMASATKAAAFAALLRVLYTGLGSTSADWRPIVWGLAVLSLLVGSIGAVVQTDVKRMLAYSSINHAGFILIGVEAASARGLAAALSYLAIYAFLALGSFAVVGLVTGRGDSDSGLSRFRGLTQRRPALAYAFVLLLLAQAGVPLTAGFVAKFRVFAAAVAGDSYLLALIGMLTAAIAAFVYLRIVLTMFLPVEEGEAAPPTPLRADPGTTIVIAVACALTVLVGVAPAALVHVAERATLLFRG